MSTFYTGYNLGQPTGISSARLIGECQINDFLYTFVTAKNSAGVASVWCKWWFNGWQQWTNLGAPPTGLSFEESYQGAAVAVSNMIYVFVRSSDAKLYCLFWNGAAWTWVLLGTPPGKAVAAVDYGWMLNPLGALVKANDGSYWFCFWNGAAWLWTAPAPDLSFKGLTTSDLMLKFQTRFARFKMAANNDLLYSMAGNNAVSTKGILRINLYGPCRPGEPSAKNAKFSVRGINPDGMQVETNYFSQYAEENGGDTYKYTIDLRQFPQFKAGADCWIACDPCADGFLKKNESASNFTFDPACTTDTAYYAVNTGGNFAPYMVYSEVGTSMPACPR